MKVRLVMTASSGLNSRLVIGTFDEVLREIEKAIAEGRFARFHPVARPEEEFACNPRVISRVELKK